MIRNISYRLYKELYEIGYDLDIDINEGSLPIDLIYLEDGQLMKLDEADDIDFNDVIEVENEDKFIGIVSLLTSSLPYYKFYKDTLHDEYVFLTDPTFFETSFASTMNENLPQTYKLATFNEILNKINTYIVL